LDTFGNSQSKRATLELTPPTTGQIGLVSVPQPFAIDSGAYEISVGRSLDYEVTLYVIAPEGECGVDLDITVDDDSDGDPTNDTDLECNQLHTEQFEPRAHEQRARIWMENNGVKKSHDLVIRFLDVEELVVPEEYQGAYDEISEILLDLPKTGDDEIIGFYKTLLINLRASLGEKEEMSSLVIDLRRLLEDYPNLLDAEQKSRATALLTTLSDSTVQSSF